MDCKMPSVVTSVKIIECLYCALNFFIRISTESTHTSVPFNVPVWRIFDISENTSHHQILPADQTLDHADAPAH